MRKILLTFLTTLLCSVTAWADCKIYFGFILAADATTAGVTNNENSFFGGLPSSTNNDLSGSITIDGTTYNVTKRSSNSTPSITFTVPTGKTGKLYAIVNGGNSRTIQLKTSSSVLVQEFTAPSGVAPYVFDDVNAGSYIITSSNNLGWGLVAVKICDAGGGCAATIPGNISKGSACAGDELTLTSAGSPETGDTWYWQASSSGTAKTNSGTTYDVSEAGTYYVRSYNTSGDCWSDAKSVTVAAGDWTSPTISGASSVTVGNTITLTGSPSGGTWASSDETKATVNSSGVVSGVAIGNTNITYSKDGCTSDNHAVTVSAACTDPSLTISLAP